MNNNLKPNFLETIFILSISIIVVFIVFYVTGNIIGKPFLENLDPWLLSLSKSIWTLITSTFVGIITQFLRAQISKGRPHPNYLILILITVLVLFAFILIAKATFKPKEDFRVEILEEKDSVTTVNTGVVKLRFKKNKERSESISNGFVTFEDIRGSEASEKKFIIRIKSPGYDTAQKKGAYDMLKPDDSGSKTVTIYLKRSVPPPHNFSITADNGTLRDIVLQGFGKKPRLQKNYVLSAEADNTRLDCDEENSCRYNSGGHIFIKLNDQTIIYTSSNEINRSDIFYKSRSSVKEHIDGEVNRIIKLERDLILKALKNELI